MPTKRAIDGHRNALALMQAARLKDTDATFQLLQSLTTPELHLLLNSLTQMVVFAQVCDPKEGWDAFAARYRAAIDAKRGRALSRGAAALLPQERGGGALGLSTPTVLLQLPGEDDVAGF